MDEVKGILERGKPIFFIDARTAPDREKTGSIVKDALRLPASEIEAHLNEIPRDRTVITY